MPSYSFTGGIHITDEHKLADASIHSLPNPSQLILPLKQHIGVAATPVVSAGDTVAQYQVLAEIEEGLGSPIHAPVAGTIAAIKPRPLTHPGGLSGVCIILHPDISQASTPLPEAADNQQAICDVISQAGIVGLGGAGFPSYAKITQPVEYLLINGAECEPYISCDDGLMQTHSQDIVAGIEILQKILQPTHTLIGIEDNKPQAIAAMQQACSHTTITVVAIPTRYPSGGEKQLIKILTNKDVSKAEVPQDVVCYNVNTAYHIKRAIHDNLPLTERVITVTGEACAKPGNYLVKIGTPIAHILKHTGCNDFAQLIYGGPLMGFAIDPTDTSITKTTNCLIAASAQESIHSHAVQECIRCGKCTEVCPMQLLPQQLYWHTHDLEKSAYYHIDNCIECACCDAVCPSHIPLASYFAATKAEIRQKTAQTEKSNHAKNRHEQREARLIRLEQQRQEKLAKQRAAIQEKLAKKKAEEKAAGKTTDSSEEKSQEKSTAKTETAQPDKQALIAAAQQRAAKKQSKQKPQRPPAHE